MSLLSAYTRLFFWPFSFCNLREHLVIYLNSFWHKTYFIHRMLKGQLYTQTEYGGIWWSSAKIQVSKLRYLPKVLVAVILHSYQNYALCFTSRFPLFHSRLMEWSEEHDVLFLREMLPRNVFGTKKGSPAHGLAWEVIVHSLNEIHSPKFQLKDKNAVRGRWNVLRKKFSK